MGDIRYASYPSGAPGNQGGRAVDFTNSIGSPANSLGKMSGLTICCWLNSGSLSFRGTGNIGNQIIFAEDDPGRNGFALSYKPSWQLQLSVNEWPSGNPANQSLGLVPVVQGPDGNAIYPSTNWVFVAVTYDGTLASQNLNFYFGSGTALAALDSGSPIDYAQGIINPVTRSAGNGRQSKRCDGSWRPHN